MSGHGHVIPNEDGVKARCGGPSICSVCALPPTLRRAESAEARVKELEGALRGLVESIDTLKADREYLGVFTFYLAHGGRYKGHSIAEAHEKARAALSPKTGDQG